MMELVTVPGIHDSELRRIEIPGNKTLSLTFETVGKELRSIVLEGVEDFRCDALLAGNIISGLWKIERPTLEDLARVACREISLKDSRSLSQNERDHIRRRQEAVQQGDLLFLRLESSYGCVMDSLYCGFRLA